MPRAGFGVLAVLVSLCWFGSATAHSQNIAPVYYNGPTTGGPPPQTGGPYIQQFDPYCPPPQAAGYGQGYEQGGEVAPGLGRQKIFDGGYVRTEYLNWSTSQPGDSLMGAPVLGNPNPRLPFVATDPFGGILGVGIVPSADPFQLDSNNGFRGTLGATLMSGPTFEVSAFVLAPTTSSFTYGNLLPQGLLVGNSTFVNGQLANNIEFYNDFYQATYRSQVWGGEANFIIDYDPTGWIQLQPMLGFRYVSLHEVMHQRGNFRDQILLFDTTTDIDSQTYNNLFGPQIGFRTEFVWNRFAVGVEPKLALTANSMIARVSTTHFRSVSDPEVNTQQSFTGFSPLFEVGFYARIPITRYGSLRVGYNIMYLSRVTRPEDNIYYNDNGPLPTLPDVVVSASRHDISLQGLTIGAEFRW